MRYGIERKLKKSIDQAALVSFDLYDTLIFRRHGTPWEVFRFMGCLLNQPDFLKERVQMQQKAYRFVAHRYQFPHPTLHEIYQYGSNRRNAQKRAMELLERKLELAEAFPNRAMQRIFAYARQSGKRLAVTTDMYLDKKDIQKILKACGYEGCSLYVSSELKKTKYNGSMYEALIKQEGVFAGEILHIGDDKRADIKMAQRFGIHTFYYQDGDRDFAESLYKRHTQTEVFWHRMGWETGGALYMGLCAWIRKYTNGKTLYCLSRDGYNLTKVLATVGMDDCKYVYASRRALLLPAIDRLGEAELALLPPYSCGQTVGEILTYLDFKEIKEADLFRQGFSGYGHVIRTKREIARLKKVYAAKEDSILKKCAKERRHLERYFASLGLFGSHALFFDSGWNGTSQYLIERIYRLLGKKTKIQFLYVGIKRNAKSSAYLQNSRYHAFLNAYLPPSKLRAALDGAAVLELFFSQDAPALLRYGKYGPVFEPDSKTQNLAVKWINAGIYDFVFQNRVLLSKPWISERGLEHYAAQRIFRLLAQPAQTEAQKIGDLESTDSLSACSGMKKYLARISYKVLLKNPYLDIYWEKGVYKHPKNPVLVKWFVWIRQRTAHIVQRKADTDYECRSCTLEKKSIRASGR